MSVRVTSNAILLEGNCPVEDAERLLAALLDHPDHVIDVDGLLNLHLAVLQLLRASERDLRGNPVDMFVRAMVTGGIATSGDKFDTG